MVGTNALPVYQIEAQVCTRQRIHATRGTDLAWLGAEDTEEPVLWPVLREYDPSFTVNPERPFQAIGKGFRELELLSAPERIDSFRGEPLRPIFLPEQSWLLQGTPLRHIITGRDRTPTALVVPDPRWFALHKRWLAEKPGRDPLKAPKDRRQARLLWRWLEAMPRYPVDGVFLDALPVVLRPTVDVLEREREEDI